MFLSKSKHYILKWGLFQFWSACLPVLDWLGGTSVLQGKMPFRKKHSFRSRWSEVYRKQRRIRKSSTLSHTGKPARFKNLFRLVLKELTCKYFIFCLKSSLNFWIQAHVWKTTNPLPIIRHHKLKPMTTWTTGMFQELQIWRKITTNSTPRLGSKCCPYFSHYLCAKIT